VADGESMPFASAVFEFAFAIKAIHQIPNRRRLFQELDRILSPGAVLVIVTPSRSRLREFPLFAANPDLAEHQMAFLPEKEDLLVEMGGTRLILQQEEAIRGPSGVAPETLVRLIRARFLSILFGLSEPALAEIEERTSKYLGNADHPDVLPYWQDGLIFVKEDSHEY
jgi:SAM-dependent methyltransferase